jgi:PAS domain S-box
MTNKTYDDLIGRTGLSDRPLADAVPELAEQGVLDVIRGVYTSGNEYRAYSALLTFRPLDHGAPIPHFLDYVLQPLKRSDGRVEAVLMLGTDVTNRVLAEQELQAREATIRETLDALPLGIVTFDRFSIVRMVNKPYAQLRGMPEHELVGMHLRDLVGEQSYKLRSPIVTAVLMGETKEFLEVRLDADGNPRQYFQKYFPRYRGSEIIGFYGTTMDLTSYMNLITDTSSLH